MLHTSISTTTKGGSDMGQGPSKPPPRPSNRNIDGHPNPNMCYACGGSGSKFDFSKLRFVECPKCDGTGNTSRDAGYDY